MKQACGHDRAAIVSSDDWTHYCGECKRENTMRQAALRHLPPGCVGTVTFSPPTPNVPTHDPLTQAKERIAALEASLGECARWLLDHGQHTPRCPVPHTAWHSTRDACTCGLDDLVQRAEALLEDQR